MAPVICLACDNPVPAPKKRGRPRKYCSARCRRRVYEDRKRGRTDHRRPRRWGGARIPGDAAPMAPRHPKGRTCSRCGGALSIYNPGPDCYRCGVGR